MLFNFILYLAKTHLERLSDIYNANDFTEAFLLRYTSEELLKKYNKQRKLFMSTEDSKKVIITVLNGQKPGNTS